MNLAEKADSYELPTEGINQFRQFSYFKIFGHCDAQKAKAAKLRKPQIATASADPPISDIIHNINGERVLRITTPPRPELISLIAN